MTPKAGSAGPLALWTAIALASGPVAALALAGGHFAAGFALLAVSVAALQRSPAVRQAPSLPEPARARRLTALAAVCVLAVFFRVYRLNSPGLWGDDAINGLLAFDVMDGKVSSPFALVHHARSVFHALTSYVIAGTFLAFGPDITTLRLPGIVAGILAVPLLYATATPLFGARVGLLAALFFASSPLQIAHCKSLTQLVLGQFFQLLGLCLLVRGARVPGPRRPSLTLAGAAFALCLYTYHSAKLAPLVAAVFLAAVIPRAGRPRRDWLKSCVYMGVAFAVLAAPGIVSSIASLGTSLEHPGEVSVWRAVAEAHSLWPAWDSLWRTLMIFQYRQGSTDWFGVGSDPALNIFLAFLFAHGMAESWARRREPRHMLLLAWFLIGILPAVLTSEAPRQYRALLATPPLYVWAALPVARLWRAAAGAGRFRATFRKTFRAVPVLLCAAVPVLDFNYYFHRVYTNEMFRWYQGASIVEMARTLRSFGPGWHGYILADEFEAIHETLIFLSRSWGLSMTDVGSLADVLPVRGVADKGVLFMMSAEAAGAAVAMESTYPGVRADVHYEPEVDAGWWGRWKSHGDRNRQRRINAVFFPVSRETAARARATETHGLLATYDGPDCPESRVEPYPYYAFFPDLCSGAFSVRWRGVLRVPAPGGYEILPSGNGDLTLILDGRPQPWGDPVEAGTHGFELQVAGITGPPRLAIRWRPPDGPVALIPPRAFTPP